MTRKLPKLEWAIERCNPAKGEMQGSLQIDHQAWLRGEGGPMGEYVRETVVHAGVQMASRHVSDEQFKTMLEAMCKGLNEMQYEKAQA